MKRLFLKMRDDYLRDGKRLRGEMGDDEIKKKVIFNSTSVFSSRK